MELRYSAIVIGKKDVGETDRIYTFLTREAGKVRAVARGVRKPEAKLAGQLETLSLGAVAVHRGRGQGNVTYALAETYHPAIRTRPETLDVALDAATLVDRVTGIEEPDAETFDLFRRFLETLETLAISGDDAAVPLVREAFSFRFLTGLGYDLEVTRCAVGGERLVSGARHSFSVEAGGIVCEIHRDPRSVPIGERGIKLLRLILGNDFLPLRKVAVGPGDLVELGRIRMLLLAHVTG